MERIINKKYFAIVAYILIMIFKVFTLDLSISQTDIKLQKDGEKGYHLYIRKKNDINSVLLCETTKDPQGNATNYAYRATEFNEVNGNEKRMLDGKFLESEGAKYSLIDSTTELDKDLGQAFHLFIPAELEWGYPWGRNGKIKIGMGTFVNIRVFEKPYADYAGAFSDNPFMFNFTTIKTVLTDEYSPDAVKAFKDISKKGEITYSKGPETIVDDIMKSLLTVNPKEKVDVVFAVDTTGSMKDDIEVLRKEFIPSLQKELASFGDLRLGLLLYRDYNDNYNYKNLPVKFFDFTDSPDKFFKQLNSFKIYGNEGGDIPEAVYEALYASINFYNWDEKSIKKIILIGDAEPHPKPRGYKIKCTKELVEEQALKKGITIDAIITPDDKTKRK